MNRAELESLDREGLIRIVLAQVEAIERLSAKTAALEAEVAELRSKLDRPRKTPDNSSVPASRGQKTTTAFFKSRKTRKAHPGAHRRLDPDPTHRRDVLASVCGRCGAAKKRDKWNNATLAIHRGRLQPEQLRHKREVKPLKSLPRVHLCASAQAEA